MVSRRRSDGARKVAAAECTGEGAGALATLCPTDEEADGAPAGDNTGAAPGAPVAMLHLLKGGVLTPQAEGRVSALVMLSLTP